MHSDLTFELEIYVLSSSPLQPKGTTKVPEKLIILFLLHPPRRGLVVNLTYCSNANNRQDRNSLANKENLLQTTLKGF
ncbi:MAG: hypothetical protein ACHBN1_27885 [Heteroscytonema crispum UTEX LB 1556]